MTGLISDLSAAASFAATDILEIIKDPSGTPASQKVTGAQIAAYLATIPLQSQYLITLSGSMKYIQPSAGTGIFLSSAFASTHAYWSVANPGVNHTVLFGTLTNNDLAILTNGAEVARFLAGGGLSIGAAGSPTVTSGAGIPSAAQPKGSLWLRTDGSGVADRAYINIDGSTGWTALATAS